MLPDIQLLQYKNKQNNDNNIILNPRWTLFI